MSGTIFSFRDFDAYYGDDQPPVENEAVLEPEDVPGVILGRKVTILARTPGVQCDHGQPLSGDCQVCEPEEN